MHFGFAGLNESRLDWMNLNPDTLTQISPTTLNPRSLLVIASEAVKIL